MLYIDHHCRQVQELHLDEKVTAGREAAAKALATGRSNISLAFMNIKGNVEKFREQRKSQDQAQMMAGAAPENVATEDVTPENVATENVASENVASENVAPEKSSPTIICKSKTPWGRHHSADGY